MQATTKRWAVGLLLLSVNTAGCGDDEQSLAARILAVRDDMVEQYCTCPDARFVCTTTPDDACLVDAWDRFGDEATADCVIAAYELAQDCVDRAMCSESMYDCLVTFNQDVQPCYETKPALVEAAGGCTATYACEDGGEVSLEQVCDGQSDCADGSDEVDCT